MDACGDSGTDFQDSTGAEERQWRRRTRRLTGPAPPLTVEPKSEWKGNANVSKRNITVFD